MSERNKITFSFLPSDSDIWDYLQSKKDTCNISEYIRNLIRQDMNNISHFIDEEKIVERIVQALQNGKIIVTENKQMAKDVLPLSNETKNTIVSLF